MKVVLAIDRDRISPVLDAARCFLLVIASSDRAPIRKTELIDAADPIAKAKRITELGNLRRNLVAVGGHADLGRHEGYAQHLRSAR